MEPVFFGAPPLLILFATNFIRLNCFCTPSAVREVVKHANFCSLIARSMRSNKLLQVKHIEIILKLITKTVKLFVVLYRKNKKVSKCSSYMRTLFAPIKNPSHPTLQLLSTVVILNEGAKYYYCLLISKIKKAYL